MFHSTIWRSWLSCCFILACNINSAQSVDDSSSGNVEVDLIFPRNDTYETGVACFGDELHQD